MTQREYSESAPDWATAPNVIMGSTLGQFRLIATTDDYTEDEDGTYHASKAVLTLLDTETGDVLLNEDVEPVMGPEFTTWDQEFWYTKAETAIEDAGHDLEALIAAAREANAA